ncbi:phage tail tip protein [Aeromonas diversa]|uniref:phage tail tip fiber protein n=1 Tax=Aeromonas diversa TaxID=502790 RepID=UPI0039A19E85
MSKSTFRASNTPQGLAENMQILTGQRGDSLDKALTLREAAAIGIVRLRRNGSGAIVPELPPAPPTDPEWTGVQPPRAPVNVKADGAFHTITLTWDAPTYHGHAFAEIWRAEKDNIATAVRVGTTLANVYSDAVGKGFKAFYWVRFVNKNSLPGPFHAQSGLFAETSKDIQDIIDGLDGQIKLSHFDGWLKKDYSGVKQDVASLESGVGYMWATKVSAGEIKAGIGIVAKSDGTSQVFLAASQVFAYDPNNPNNSAPMFAIDQGKVVIQEALIRSATIQILKSEKITADYIKAGASISAPLITGGQFDMGNAFMAGGAAGFGKGGPYSGWNWGWHTIIYSDGSIYTNRLNADGGYVRNMTIRNCTIEEDCVVKGTVYAERIVGDVVAVKSLSQVITGPTDITFTVPSTANMDRDIVVTGINVQVEGDTSGGGGDHSDTYTTRTTKVTFLLNGNEVSHFIAEASGRGNKDSCSPSFHHRLAAGLSATITIRIKVSSSYGGYGINLSGAIALVTKVGSATFG